MLFAGVGVKSSDDEGDVRLRLAGVFLKSWNLPYLGSSYEEADVDSSLLGTVT